MVFRILQLSAASWALGLILSAAAPAPAQAIALNKCVRVIHNPQVSRETLVNTCRECMVAKIERRRPGDSGAPPSSRNYTLPGGAQQPLPFLGPGKTRIMTEFPCPGVPQ